MRLPSWLAQHLAALRALLVLTVVTGLAYPLVITAVAQLPGLKHRADGSLVTVAGGTAVGSSIIGQSFTDKDGNPMAQYFQSRPSAAGDGYDPTATSASNLGPESVVDTLGDPAQAKNPDGDGSSQSLLTQVCSRSLAVGKLEGVDGRRPYCTADGVGAVLAVFYDRRLDRADHPRGERQPGLPGHPVPGDLPRRDGRVREVRRGLRRAGGIVTPIRGSAPAKPVVPSDAVTASASGLDPDISPAYANLQAPRIARERGLTLDQVHTLIKKDTDGRALGFIGEPGVNVLKLNLALDRLPVATAPAGRGDPPDRG